MVDNNKSLTTNDGFLKKIVNFFKKLFSKGKTKTEYVPNIEVKNISVNNDAAQKQNQTVVTEDMFNEEGMPKAEYLPIILERIKEDLEKNQKEEVSYQKTDEEKTEEARRFFEIYNKVKSNEINLSEIDSIDLIKVNRMLKEEIKIRKDNF